MKRLALVTSLALVAACSGIRSYTRSTPMPLDHAYACAVDVMKRLGYTVELQDSVGLLVQGRREITGLVETARRSAAAATDLITVGLAGGKRTRYDELTVFVYTRPYPQGNTIEATAGMLSVGEGTLERASPTDLAKREARALLTACAPR
ncbi:MAG TPA: hypothetical protein VF167_17035 [Longimicrobiaceae bacterium]